MKNLEERMLAVIKLNEPQLAAELCSKIAHQHALDVLNGDTELPSKEAIKDEELMKYIINLCATQFGVTVEAIQSKKRHRIDNTVFARQAFCFFCRSARASLSLAKIGRYIYRDHATVLHGIKMVEYFAGTDRELHRAITNIANDLDAKGFENCGIWTAKIDTLWNRKKFV
jgi:chromosomal replication initiation ATPase DnaA